jgi:hypothetical protein
MSYGEDLWEKAGDTWNDWFRSGGGNGGSEEFGGMSEEDKAFKKMLYDQYNSLKDQEYESYGGDRYADRSPEELAMLEELKAGGGYQEHYDKASKDLGFTKDVYKTGAQYGVDQLDKDASKLMSSDPYRNQVSERILRDMNRGASMSGMDLAGKQNFGGTGGGDRADLARLSSNLGYSEKAGDALSNLHYGALKDSRSSARQLNLDRQDSAGKYGKTVMTDLGIGTGGLDTKYSTMSGAFGSDRKYQDRDLNVGYQDWKDKKNWDWKKLSAGSNLFSGMPIEEKGMTTQPATGGK